MLEKIKHYLKKIWQTKKFLIILIIILLLGLGLRLVNISSEPYWSDEILSLEIAKYYLDRPVDLWHYLQIAEVHPPLYYYLIQIWGKWFGFHEGAIRSLSVLFSLGLIYLAYVAGLILFKNKKIGLLAAFFTAILPLQIEFGQEARPYAIFSFLGILSLIILAKYFEANKFKTKFLLLIIFSISSVLGLYLHYSYMLILIPLSIYWLGKTIIEKNGSEFIWWLCTMGVIYLGFYAWLPTLIFKSFLTTSFVPESQRAVYDARPMVFFEYMLNNLIWPDKETPTIFEIIAVIITKFTLIALIIRTIVQKKEWFIKNKKALSLLISTLILSIFVFLIFPSSTKYTILLCRHLLFDSLILAILLAIIFILIEKRNWRIIFISLFLVSLITFQANILSNDVTYDFNHRFKIVVDYLNKYYQKDDLLLVNTTILRPQLNYYLRKDLPGFIGVLPAQLILPDFAASRYTMGMIENEAQLRTFDINWELLSTKLNYLIKKHQAKRVWMIGDTPTFLLRKWFVYNGWRVGFEPIVINNKKLFPLTLYVLPKTNK